MAIAASSPVAPVAERQPGQFRRHATTGAPFVAHPTQRSAENGTKAELIAKCAQRGIAVPEGKACTVAALKDLLGDRPTIVQYGRPSSLGKQIEDQTNLQKWAERMVALGIARDAELHRAALELADLDQESNEFREAADAVARRAKTAAQAMLAAERGTHHHELTEDLDNERDPVLRIAAGEQLGVPEASQRALLAAWGAMLATFDIEILATEATCVDDLWRQAGTLDRICRLRRDLRFITVTGEFVTLPAGWVGILDIKTGRLRLDRAGFVAYWQGYSVQLASYAQSVPYDPDTDTRGEWAWPIDQRWAIIAHLDVLAALDGEAVCRLVLVDIEAGRHAGDLCVAAKAWEKRTDVFSLPIDDLTVRVPVEQTSTGGDPASVAGGPIEGEPAATVNAAEAPDEPAGGESSAPPAVDQLATVTKRTERSCDHVLCGDTCRAGIDEGAQVGRELAVLQREYGALDPDGRAWITALTDQAMRAGVSFHLSSTKTVRRFEIVRALVLLAQQGLTDDQAVRDLLEPIIGDPAQFPSVPVGHLIGSLDASEAAKFAGLVDGRFAISFTTNGKPTLQPAA